MNAKERIQMRKRLLALFLAVMLCITGIIAGDAKAYAQDVAQDVEILQIWTEDALVGYAQLQTRGLYLAEGVSIINDAGGGKIGCGGITTAAIKCKVSINSVVERKVGSSWVRVTSWSSIRESAYSASISKTLSVGSGYYYRVRSVHTAASDGSSSCTDSFWM